MNDVDIAANDDAVPTQTGRGLSEEGFEPRRHQL